MTDYPGFRIANGEPDDCHRLTVVPSWSGCSALPDGG